MPIRPLTKEDMLANARLGSICYNFPYNEEKTLERLHNTPNPEKGYWGYFDENNTLEAALGSFEYDVFYQGKPSKMAGIGNVVSLPEARRGGKVRELFTKAVEEMYEKNIPFSTLYPFSHPYYEKFGYALACETASYKIPISALPKNRQNTWAKQLTQGDDLTDLLAVYNQFNAAYNIASLRNEEQWKKLLPKNPYEENSYAYILGDDHQGANAFVLFSSKDDKGEKNMAISSFVFTSPQGLYNCFNFFYRFSGQFEQVLFTLPKQISIPYLLPEPYNMGVYASHQPMARVVDPKQVLALLAADHKNLSFSIEVIDGFFAPANGIWQVQNGTVTDASAPADCCLSIHTFSQLALGALTFEQALYKSDVQCANNKEALVAFFKVNPFYLTDAF